MWGHFNRIILLCSVDRWDIWKEYLNSVFELMSVENRINNHENHESSDNDLETVDDTPEKAHEFICRVVENGVDNGTLTIYLTVKLIKGFRRFFAQRSLFSTL